MFKLTVHFYTYDDRNILCNSIFVNQSKIRRGGVTLYLPPPEFALAGVVSAISFMQQIQTNKLLHYDSTARVPTSFQ